MHHYPADFIAGTVAMGYLIVGLFFLRFWRRTGDGLFLIFALAFWLLTANAVTFQLAGISRGEGSVYLLRLAAFALIIAGMVGKNLRSR